MSDAVSASQEAWRATRTFLNQNRLRLAATAVELYPDLRRVEGTVLLSRAGWLPAQPLDLGDVRLRWEPAAGVPATAGGEPESERVRPLQADGRRFATYADAVAALDRPRLFENRPSYRLVGADLADDRRLTFAEGRYFDVMNVAEAVAHEYADQVRVRGVPGWSDLPFRSRLGDPFDLTRRPLLVATSALTLRRDAATGAASFVLHWRDPRRVASGGGLYQVMPVGVFQPTGEGEADRANDFDLWRGLVREYSEEFLGAAERTGEPGGVLEYEAWPFYRAMCRARAQGRLRVHCFGIGIDPLTLVADVLLAAVFDGEAFDELLGAVVSANDEGRVVTGGGGGGFPFSRPTIEGLLRDEPMQPAGGAALALAWRHRDLLLTWAGLATS
jgi:hypothetical protein